MKFTIGFSPCPNDTFIFDALINKKIDTKGYDFEFHLEDVQTLNNWAIDGKLDFSKISYGVLPLVLNKYIVLNSGGALGKGVGPLLISKAPIADYKSSIKNLSVAIPGVNTTAHMLFNLAFPNTIHKKFVVFNQVEDAVLNGEVDAGVIIHENRFTFQQKGLTKLIDLGEYWEQQTGAPIPLGGIISKRNLDINVIKEVDDLIKQSVEYSYKHYPFLSDYITSHAQEMEEDVMRKHIDLYVNNYSINLGIDGKKAVEKLLDVFNYPNKEDVFVQ